MIITTLREMNMKTKETQKVKYYALNDMNRLNIPIYLLNEFNDRRMRKARLKGAK